MCGLVFVVLTTDSEDHCVLLVDCFRCLPEIEPQYILSPLRQSQSELYGSIVTKHQVSHKDWVSFFLPELRLSNS